MNILVKATVNRKAVYQGTAEGDLPCTLGLDGTWPKSVGAAKHH